MYNMWGIGMSARAWREVVPVRDAPVHNESLGAAVEANIVKYFGKRLRRPLTPPPLPSRPWLSLRCPSLE